MKKRILSFMVALSMLLPIFNVTAFSAEDIKSDKQYMEQYIRNLTDGGDYMKYTNQPFDEYNNLVSRKVYNDDFDMLVATGDVLNNATKMLSWVIKNGFGNSDSYTEAKYEALCAEWLTKVTNKSTNEELASNIAKFDEIEKKNRKFDEIVIEFADVLAKKTETSTAYNRLHESFLGDKELINAVGESTFIKGFPVITSLFSVLIRDYEENEKYLEIMKNTVYEIALSHEELANTITDKKQAESMKKEAQAMRNAVDKVIQKYKDRASGAFNELTDLIIQYGTKEKFDELKTIVGKETFKGVFKLFDLTTFGIELFMNISGLGDIAKGSANTIFMFPITLNMQNKFFEEGKLCLSDGDFSDEDYEHMSLLFDLCRAAQEINCEYADVIFDKNNKTNEQIIQEYVNYAMGGGKKEFRYEVIEQPMTWEEAKVHCESLGGHLVSITSEEEQKIIEELLRQQGDNAKDCYMIGLHRDFNNFGTWITGESVEYANWSGSPHGVWDFYGGAIGVIHIKGSNFSFLADFGDWCCFKDKKYPFICEYDDVEPPMTENDTIQENKDNDSSEIVDDSVLNNKENESEIDKSNDKEISVNDISKSEYLKAQEYLKALQVGTDDAMEKYIYNYGSGDMNPDIQTYTNTDEYQLDIYLDETFNLNFKTAYLNENSAMQTYKNKNHYILILPDNAQDLNEGYHYLVEGDGTDFKYNALPVGNYTAYVRSDLCNEVGGDLAQFKITVHDLEKDSIDDELQVAIDFLNENGSMTGYEDGIFRPNKSMTRAEFAAIICRFTDNDIEFTGENNAFSDVFGDYWGYDYVMNAYQKGLLKGYGGGIFGCDDTLTEEQAITVLCRMLGDTYEDVSYIETSVDEKGGYSEGYISIAGERGIDIEGLQKTVPATRARVAKWLYQLYNIKNNF